MYLLYCLFSSSTCTCHSIVQHCWILHIYYSSQINLLRFCYYYYCYYYHYFYFIIIIIIIIIIIAINTQEVQFKLSDNVLSAVSISASARSRLWIHENDWWLLKYWHSHAIECDPCLWTIMSAIYSTPSYRCCVQ